MTFTRVASGVGNNAGLPKTKRMIDEDPIRFDAKGNPMPTAVRRYPFADEYTYRI